MKTQRAGGQGWAQERERQRWEAHSISVRRELGLWPQKDVAVKPPSLVCLFIHLGSSRVSNDTVLLRNVEYLGHNETDR